MRIYKYQIPLEERFSINMEIDSKILSFQEQYGILTLWALVHPNSSYEQRKFFIAATGEDIDIDCIKEYIGTVQQLKGSLVWHLFERK